MSELTRLGILATIIQAVVLVVVIAKTNKLIKREKNFFSSLFLYLVNVQFFSKRCVLAGLRFFEA